MAYSDYTLSRIRQQFGLTILDHIDPFVGVPPRRVPPALSALLDRQMALALKLNTEKARSEMIIAPILLEIKFAAEDRVGYFSGVDFPVDHAAGLSGRCDFLLTRNPSQFDINAPVCVIVEAKTDNLVPGLPQAIAEMIAARRFNEQSGLVIDPIFGAVTTGNQWRFLQLAGGTVLIDRSEYLISDLPRIFGILSRMVLGEDEPPVEQPPPPAPA